MERFGEVILSRIIGETEGVEVGSVFADGGRLLTYVFIVRKKATSAPVGDWWHYQTNLEALQPVNI